MMRDAIVEGHLQVLASASLLENSRLVEWKAEASKFVAVPREAFELSWRTSVDPIFGRLICWIGFSAGAELLVKGMCLLHGIEIRSKNPSEVPLYPSSKIESWAAAYRDNFACRGTAMVYQFGALASLLPKNRQDGKAPLLRLCQHTKATPQQEDMLVAAYDLLRRAIRNRDAHAYVPNVRDSHHNLVPELFVDCFNLLASWLPEGAQTLNEWRADAPEFVASVS